MEADLSSEGHFSWVLWRTHSLDWSFYNTGNDISLELVTKLFLSLPLRIQNSPPPTRSPKQTSRGRCKWPPATSSLPRPAHWAKHRSIFAAVGICGPNATLSSSHPYSAVLDHSFLPVEAFSLCGHWMAGTFIKLFKWSVWIISHEAWGLEKITPEPAAEVHTSSHRNSLAYFELLRHFNTSIANMQGEYLQPEVTCEFMRTQTVRFFSQNWNRTPFSNLFSPVCNSTAWINHSLLLYFFPVFFFFCTDEFLKV